MPLWLALLLLAPGENLIANGSLEDLADGYPVGWTRGWCRDGAEQLAVGLEEAGAHDGARCLRLTHRGEHDWSVHPAEPLAVQPGDILDLSIWLKLPGTGHVVLGAAVFPATYPEQGEAGVDWVAGERRVDGPRPDWVRVTTRVIIGPGMVRATPRLIGTGPVEVLLDDFQVRSAGNLEALRAAYSGPARLDLRAGGLVVGLEPTTGAWSVTIAGGRVWRSPPDVTVTKEASATAAAALLKVEAPALALPLTVGVAAR